VEESARFGTDLFCKHFLDSLKLIIKPPFAGFPRSWGFPGKFAVLKLCEWFLYFPLCIERVNLLSYISVS
jgi:hypothetical protein